MDRERACWVQERDVQEQKQRALEREKEQLEVDMTELTSFMASKQGESFERLERELAEAKMSVAELLSEKDQLEFELMQYQQATDRHRQPLKELNC